jgi:hypothetical protein
VDSNTYTGKLRCKGGDAVSPIDVTYDETFGSSDNEQNRLHVRQWMTGDNGNGSNVTAGTKVTITADATCMLKWDANYGYALHGRALTSSL